MSSAPSTAYQPSEGLRTEWKALSALCIGFFMILLDQTIVAVATPQLYNKLNASLTQVVWVTSAYLLCFAVPLLVTGRLGDRFGQRNVYLAGMVVFTISSLACGLSSSIAALITARAVQGIGAALLVPQTTSIINRIFPPFKRGAAMGIWGAVAGLANLAGPLLGGIIVTNYGWQWIFLINVPIGVVSIVMVYAWVPELPLVARQIDVSSVFVSIVGVTALVYAVQQGPEHHWGRIVWALLAVAVALIALLLVLQKRAESKGRDPLIPLSIFGYRNFSIGNFSIAMMGFCVSSMMLPIMLYLQEDLGLDAEHAGFVLVPMAIVAGGFAPFTGRMSDRVHPRIMSTVGFGGCAASLAVASFMMLSHTSAWVFSIPVMFFGIFSAFVWSPNAVATMRELPPELTGAGSGVYNTTRQVGSVIGAAAVGAAMTSSVALALAIPAAALVCGFVSVTQYTFPKTQ